MTDPTPTEPQEPLRFRAVVDSAGAQACILVYDGDAPELVDGTVYEFTAREA